MSEIEYVAIPLAYQGGRNPSIEIEYQTAKGKLQDKCNEGFKLHATHTMVVSNIGYIVHILVKEGGIK